jgi:hypothetical protein
MMMVRKFIRYLLTVFFICLHGIGSGQQLSASGPQIEVFPPEIHQMLAPEGHISRYLQVYNLGDDTLIYSSWFEPWQGEGDTTVSWVTAYPLAGVIIPGDTSVITFDFNSLGLDIQDYLVDLVIASNDSLNPRVRVLAMLHVTPLEIYIMPENDSIQAGDSTRLNVFVFGGSDNFIFSWTSNPPGFYSSEKEPYVSPQVNTYFILEVIDGGFTQKDSVLIKVGGASNVAKQRPALWQLVVYPNPASDFMVIRIDAAVDMPIELEIIDRHGREIKTVNFDLHRGVNEHLLELKSLPAGAYLLRLKALHEGSLYDGGSVKFMRF